MFQRLLIRRRSAFRLPPFSLDTLKAQLNLPALQDIETISVYSLYNAPEDISTAIRQVFTDPVSDEVIDKLPQTDGCIIVEPLPGQFDQRADSAEQCLQLISPNFAHTKVRSAIAYLISGNIEADGLQRLKHYLINPIESREKDLSQTELPVPHAPPATPRYPELLTLSGDALAAWHKDHGLAMTLADLVLVQAHFQSENRAPTETEIRVLDTYWSDHCRHTTFATQLENIRFPENPLGKAMRADYDSFIAQRRAVYGNAQADRRPITLMELATIDAKYLKSQGKLDDVEFSAEVNACSIFIDVTEDQSKRQWLLQFKNETHNHPTEIEPFGGASTCIGGAIRDPLSGRAYVYQAMRLSGSADPREAIAETLAGKLPQIVIAQRSAAGASSYGNQIGLATGQVVEVYHDGYKAKHMEVGAVVAAVPAEHVRREEPAAGDLVILLGGATGRDGCGGATGSSREQHGDSLTESAAEVQKGNPPEERKLQRLFRKAAFAQKIKRCNDFGAGGVSVAIGELAAGIAINLNAVPVKYQGLSGTELAISESQERMAIVIDKQDFDSIAELAAGENLSAAIIAEVTAEPVLSMHWQGDEIVRLSRAFLDSNGAPSIQTEVSVPASLPAPAPAADWHSALTAQLQELAHSDQRGLGDRFDFNVGASCVLMPYGGRFHATPSEASVYKLPTDAATDTASILAYGFDPDLSEASPYHGAIAAVTEAAARLIAVGGDLRRAHFSLQEYFPKLGADPERWGLPAAALLGAHHALSGIERAAIGGKDSMSGSFNQLDVPPTLIAFAVAPASAARTVSAEFKTAGNQIYWLRCPQDELGRPDFNAFKENNLFIQEALDEGIIRSIRSVRRGGIIQAIYEAAIGSRIGADIDHLDDPNLAEYGGFLISSDGGLGIAANLIHLGYTTDNAELNINGRRETLENLQKLQQTLHDVYPLNPAKTEGTAASVKPAPLPKARPISSLAASPRVCIPVFPGTNSELDTARAFAKNGGIPLETVIRNRSQNDIQASLQELEADLKTSQIFVLSGGFSAGDEPDGSGKFIANILFNPQIRDAVHEFLARDGLILGICNGFQALIKSGLLPHGSIQNPTAADPTLTHNRCGRHIARIATTIICNNHSPWLSEFAAGEAHSMPLSHGEGRFVCTPETFEQLSKNGQIAAQYADPRSLAPSMNPKHNPNGSSYAVEAITSPCGRILGKMGHSERWQENLYKNHPGYRPQNIFRAGIRAFK